MIGETRIHNQQAHVAPQADGARAAGREQAVAPADLFVSGGQPAADSLGSARMSQDPGAPDPGTGTSSAGAGNTVSGAVTGGALGPCGSSLVQTLSAVAPTLARTIELAELEVREQKLDQGLQELEDELKALGAGPKRADAPPMDGVPKEREAADRGGVPTALTVLWRTAQKVAEGQRTALEQREAALRQEEAALEGRKACVPELVAREAERLQGLLEAQLTETLYGVDDDLRAKFNAEKEQLRQAHLGQESRLAEELRAREAALQAPQAPDRARITQLASQVQEQRGYVTEWEAAIARSRANAAELTARATRALSNVENDRSRLASEVRSTQSEIRTLESQVRSVGHDLQAAERKVKDASSDCDRIRRGLV